MRNNNTRALFIFLILFATTNISIAQCPVDFCTPNTGSARITKVPTCFNEVYEISLEGEFNSISIISSVGEALLYSNPIRVSKASTVTITYFSYCIKYLGPDAGGYCGFQTIPVERTQTFVIPEDAPTCNLSALVTTITPESKYGCRDGSATITVNTNACNGWQGFFQYSGFVNGSSGEPYTFKNLSAGTFDLKIYTSDGSCDISVPITIPGPVCELSGEVTSTTPVSGYGARDGTVTIRVTTNACNGWYAPDGRLYQSGESFTLYGLAAGEGTAYIATSTGDCNRYVSYTIPSPVCSIDARVISVSAPAYGCNNGLVTINATTSDINGWLGPDDQYHPSGGDATFTLPVGQNSIEIRTGSAGCSQILTVIVPEGSRYYLDSDGDGFGDPAKMLQDCIIPAGYVTNNADCDDTKPNVYPGATELCDGVDNDCDGTIDDGITFATYYTDIDGDGYGDASQSLSSCSTIAGYVTTAGDCNDNNAAIKPGAVEVCDGLDNNCNGQIDEDVNNTYYPDADGDSYGKSTGSIQACAAPSGYVSNSTDCDDSKANVYPGAAEICDGLDNDCDGTIDDGITLISYYKDNDGDGFGDAAISVSACTAPASYVSAAGDCNDNNAAIKPGAAEVCDGIDNNCNGQIDEGGLNTYYPDEDGDGYGKSTGSVQACAAPAGFVSSNTDCDDTKASVYPGAPELCDGLDNDCDGTIDDGITLITYFKDNDGDGFGDAAISVSACVVPAGYVSAAGDCNDNNAAIKPGAVEVCDGIDNNCNGQIDEWVKNTYYQDSDGDGYGNASVSIQACVAPTGYVSKSTDCNDNNAAVKPSAIEICGNNIDDDCDGLIDETCIPATLPFVQISNASVKEGNSGTTIAVFNLRLSSRSSVPVTIQYQTSNGTAIAPADYVNSTGTITFPANTLLQTITVQVKGDLLNETNEKFSVTISNPVNATISNNTGTGTIQNDDKFPALRIDDAAASESSQQVQLKVYLTTASEQVVTVNYDTKNKTAKAPGDYTEINNAQLTFQPGETEKFISVVIKQDNLNELTEQFEVNLRKANNAQLSANQGGKKASIVNILNSFATSININSNIQAMNTTKQQLNLQVKVFPNPSRNYFQLNITGNGKGTLHLRVTDILGRVMEDKKLEGMAQQIKLGENWRNGTYILEVIQGEERKTIQLVKLR